MKITKVTAREIFDSRGLPTVECTLLLEDDTQVQASVPSGTSRSVFEALELRDGGQRLLGQGVTQAIEHIQGPIAQVLVGCEPNLLELDTRLVELDGTPNKAHMGTNALLATSIAICRAQAYMYEMEPYELIAHLLQVEHVNLPYPLFNIVNGGAHANNKMPIQEFMIVPMGAQHFRDGMEIGVTVFHILKQLLDQQGLSTGVGDEGGFAPMVTDERFILDLIMQAIALCGLEQQGLVTIALDVAASQLYDPTTRLYHWRDATLSSEQLIEHYVQLAKDYPIYSIEDGLSEVDWSSWKYMTEQLGTSIQLVGDDLFATNSQRIIKGLQDNVANAALIKPNQIGTVTETLQAIRLCQEHNMNTIVSHRSGETNDSFIVDLAVGSSAGQIKAGGCSRGECMAKYNRLLEIEDELTLALLD